MQHEGNVSTYRPSGCVECPVCKGGPSSNAGFDAQRTPSCPHPRASARRASALLLCKGWNKIVLTIRCEGAAETIMAKLSKLVAAKRGRVLLVRRRRDRIWMFPGVRRRGLETAKDCLRREIREELPKRKLGRVKLWKEVDAKNPRA